MGADRKDHTTITLELAIPPTHTAKELLCVALDMKYTTKHPDNTYDCICVICIRLGVAVVNAVPFILCIIFISVGFIFNILGERVCALDCGAAAGCRYMDE